MSRNGSILKSIDWLTVGMFLALSVFGLLNIYGASYDFEHTDFFAFSSRSGKQIVWIAVSLLMGSIVLLIDSKTYDILAYIIYALWIVVLFITPFVTRDIKGSLSWLVIGPLQMQPAEFAKCFTALAIAKYMSRYEYRLRDLRDMIVPMLLLIVPMFIIMVMQKETGSALVFAAFFFMFYREGMSGYVLLIGAAAVFFFILVIRLSVVSLPFGTGTAGMLIAMLLILLIELYFLFFTIWMKKEALILGGGVIAAYGVSCLLLIWFNVNFDIASTIIAGISVLYLGVLALRWRHRELLFLLLFSLFSVVYCHSCDLVFHKLLKTHQRERIEVLLGLKDDPSGAGYNVNQAKIAISSGGFLGKGFKQGTQTKLQFVPEQATDFIFCTVGEEWGFVGTSMVLILYLIFILRLIYLAERQKDRFSRIYAYSVAFIFFTHLAINVGMVLGLLPVIGIPLPFFTYGGSSMLGFSLLLFILLKLDASRVEKMR